MRKSKQFAGGALPHVGSNGGFCSVSVSGRSMPLNLIMGSTESRDFESPGVLGRDGLSVSGASNTPNCASLSAVTRSAASTGGRFVPRRRFQRGALMQKSGRWYGVYRADGLQADGTVCREQRWQSLGLVCEQSERSAGNSFSRTWTR